MDVPCRHSDHFEVGDRDGAKREGEADPAERNDRAAAEPILAAYHRQALQETIARLSRRPVVATGDQPEMTREQCENLKALGYLAASVDCSKLP